MAVPEALAGTIDWREITDVIAKKLRRDLRFYPSADIEELTQDVLERLADPLRARYDPEEHNSFERFARCVTFGVVRNFRRKVRIRSENLGGVSETEKAGGLGPYGRLERLSVRERLREILEKDPELATLFQWVVDGEDRPEALALLLEQPVSTVKNAKRRLKTRVKKLADEIE